MNAFLFHSLVRTNFSNDLIGKDNQIKLFCLVTPLSYPSLGGVGGGRVNTRRIFNWRGCLSAG